MIFPNKSLRAVLWVNLLLSVGVLVSASQGPDLSDEKARVIFKSALEALGGDRFINMHDRLAIGRVYSFFRDQTVGSDLARIYTGYLPDAPHDGVAVQERQYLGKKLDYSYLFLKNQAWELTFRGARPVEEELWQRYVRTTQNDILYLLKVRQNEPGLFYEFIGSEVYLSRHVEIIDITDAQRRTIRVYFDHNTHLPIRETFTWLDPDTKYRNDEVLEYDKFRDIGAGVMWPFTVERSRNGYKTFQMFANSVEANVAAPPGTFALPNGTKILNK